MASAIEECLGLINTELVAAGLATETNRDEAEILQSDEYPVAAIYWGGAEIERIDSCNALLWNGQVVLDFWSKVAAGQTPMAQCNAMIAAAAAAIQTRQRADSFGGKFHACEPTEVSDFASLQGDTGSMSLTLSVQFWTTKDDWTAIYTD